MRGQFRRAAGNPKYHATAIDAPMLCLTPKPKKNLILPVASVVPEDKKLYSKSDNFQ
ncbi:hypothetical protein [Sodalis praecaptivus]|uniref:hypothetical protein n=1 Tax=Sodalis TaxID=84565 RepID=UPI00130E82B2|nr:hypothetical protein [Sodalis praecaptivus]